MRGRNLTTIKESIIRRAAVVFAAAATVLILAAPSAFGLDFSGGSHVGFTSGSGSCALCHRSHTGAAKNLLKSNSMCVTCHGHLMGADTDTVDGVYADSKNPAHSWATDGGTLLGGGFKYLGGTAGKPVTSAHHIGDIDGVALDPITPYGSTTGASIALGCTDCHSMHSDFENPASVGQYRLLSLDPGKSGQSLAVAWNGPWTDGTQTAKTAAITATTNMGYTEHDFSGDPAPASGLVEYTRNYRSGMSAWCEGCHSVYGTPEGAGGSPDNVPYHRHKMDVPLVWTARLSGAPATDLPLNDLGALGRSSEDLMNCATCHRAHGTDKQMSGTFLTAGRIGLPAMNTSMLLRLDNRGVCINCHAYLNSDTY